MMRYLLIALILLPITLFAHVDDKLFMEYYNEQNFTNFLKTVSYYGERSDQNNDVESDCILMNALFLELQNTLSRVLENIDSLSFFDKFQTANMLLKLGHLEQALILYDDLLVNAPNWSCALRYKGEAYFKMKDYEKAERELIKSIEANDQHYDAYLMLTDVYLQQSKYQKAYDIMQSAFAFRGNNIADEEEIYSLEAIETMYLDILKGLKKTKEINEWEKKINAKK